MLPTAFMSAESEAEERRLARLPSACGMSVRLPNQLQPELNLA